uniref:RNase H type-1 domain-containing protein n=1 Tax=Cannabis sativa TaxID=3483 RepID=A0A803NNP9_CANSA
MEEFLVLCWRIWYRRNTFVHDKKMLSDELVSQWALSFLWHYQDAKSNLDLNAHVKPTETVVGLSSGSSKTFKLGNFNLFVDAGINEGNSCMGLGAVMIDGDGLVLCSSSDPVAASFHTHVAEATSLLSGLLLCCRLGYNSIIVFSNFLCLV